MAEPQKLGGKDQVAVVSQTSKGRELNATAAVAAPDAAAASDKIVLRDVSDVIAWLGDTAAVSPPKYSEVMFENTGLWIWATFVTLFSRLHTAAALNTCTGMMCPNHPSH